MKTNKTKKLSLATQTLRSLQTERLSLAAGGYLPPSQHEGSSCPVHNSCTQICLR